MSSTMYYTTILISLVNIELINSINNPKRIGEEQLSIVEYYNIDTDIYMFFSERVTWDEAETICRNYDAQLAIVNTPSKANKLAAAMGESNIEMEDLWIGGQRSDKGIWAWLNQIHISPKPSHGFPPWVRKPNRRWKECVALHRFAIDQPLFIDLDCSLPKPFCCQRDSDAPGNLGVALPSHTVLYAKSTYILYHARVTWGMAATFCRIRGYRLAVIPNNAVAKIVSTAMMRSRPSFENVWLGGHFYHNKWTWLPTGETIASVPDHHNYPPWHHNSTHQTSGCILMDRHVCNDPVFLAFSCDHKRDFVCEKYTKITQYRKHSDIKDISHKKLRMLLVLRELSWYEAKNFCHKENGYLTEVSGYDMLKVITTAMGDQESEPMHIWLGGMLINDTWTWVKTKKPVPTLSTNTSFMPWCDIEQKEDDDCLNLDREAHNKPVIYGLNCEMKQPFVCTIDDTASPKSGCKLPAVPLWQNNLSFVAFFTPSSYELTSHECVKAGGKLADVKQEDVAELTDQILNTRGNGCKEMNFWVLTKSKCSQLNLNTKTIEDAADCSKQQGYICQPICAPPKSGDAIWKCRGKPRLQCKAACKDDAVLVGPDTITCTASGWVFNKTTTFLPSCLSHQVATADLIDVIGSTINQHSGFLFVVDESYSVTASDWKLQLQFVASILQVFPLTTNWKMGLILFSNAVRVPVPYGETNTCKVLETLTNLTPNKERDLTLLHGALVEAKNQIEIFQADLPSIIICIGDGDYNGEPYDEILHILKKRHLIISIGINTGSLQDLNNLASIKDDKVLMYHFQNFKSIQQSVLNLLQHRSKALQCPNNLYTLANNANNRTKMKVKKRQDISTNETLCKDNPISIKLKGITYTTFFLRSTYAEAKFHCFDDGGRLANVNKNQLEIIINWLTHKLNGCNDEEFWINKRNLSCSTLHIGKRQINNCTKDGISVKLNFICENVIAGCPDPPTDNKHIYKSWNCENRGKFKNCSVKCKGQAVMAGTSVMTCNANGWVTLNNENTNFPLCLTNEEFEGEFIPQIQKLKDHHGGFLFVFDNSHRQNKPNGTLKQLNLMKVILEIFPPSDNFPVGLVLLDGNAKVQIPYNETRFCLIRRKLHHLKHKPPMYQPTDRQHSYMLALIEVQNQITTMQPTRKTLIFFVSDRGNSGNDYTNVLSKLKEKHTIISIGGSYDGLKDLNTIASMSTDNLLMYTFKSYNYLDYAIKIIKQHYSKHYKCAGDL